jgi:hypothetical protein
VISFFLASNDQSNLLPAFNPHCFTINIGIVVRNDALFGAFNANVVSSPINTRYMCVNYHVLSLSTSIPQHL